MFTASTFLVWLKVTLQEWVEIKQKQLVRRIKYHHNNKIKRAVHVNEDECPPIAVLHTKISKSVNVDYLRQSSQFLENQKCALAKQCFYC